LVSSVFPEIPLLRVRGARGVMKITPFLSLTLRGRRLREIRHDPEGSHYRNVGRPHEIEAATRTMIDTVVFTL